MKKEHSLLTGTVILTSAGILCRVIGFFYRIFLSRTIGAEQMGIYQLVLPVYALALSLCTGGIQNVLMRFLAESEARKDKARGRAFFSLGTALTVCFSLLLSLLVFLFAEPIGCRLLLEPETVPLLRILALAIAPSALHAALSSWFFSKKKPGFPSFCQFLEQIMRFLATFLALSLFCQGRKPSALIAAFGTLCGELFSSVLTLLVLFFVPESPLGKRNHVTSWRKDILVPLFSAAFPLTLNRVLLNVLHLLESALLPGSLVLSGLSRKAALGTYGVLSGMALPMILFPSAIPQAFSFLLLPEIAETSAKKNEKRMIQVTDCSLLFCMILGIYCTGIFFFLGPDLGMLFFHKKMAGDFLRALSFLCPFLYLETTLASIENGLGKTSAVFFQNAAGYLLRILILVFFVPSYGISACLFGILAGEIVITLLALFFLKKACALSFSLWRHLLCPALSFGAALLLSRGASLLAGQIVSSQKVVLLFAILFSGALYLLFLLPLITDQLQNRR